MGEEENRSARRLLKRTKGKIKQRLCTDVLIYISLSLKLYMRHIVSAESKSLFNYGIRTEKIFQPTQPWTFRGAGNQKNPDSDVGVGLG